MREKLIQYVDLLFTGVSDAEDIKQEILQNTLDKYDDLINQGKAPEAAYRLAISGIGDINEILGNTQQHSYSPSPNSDKISPMEIVDEIQHRKMRAVAVAMYILCPVPLFILSELGYDTLGLCLLLLLVAAATALLIMAHKKDPDAKASDERRERRTVEFAGVDSDLKKLIDTVTLVAYFVLSFLTQAWHITWILFLIKNCVLHLIGAIQDCKEAKNYES